MSLHINRFIDRVRSAEHRGQRDFVMTMAEARDLQADLAKLLLALHAATQPAAPHATDTIEINGGAF
jgi:hypothetical protein